MTTAKMPMACLILVLAYFHTPPLWAESPDDIQEYRHQFFESLSRQVKASKVLVEDKVPGMKSHLSLHARTIAESIEKIPVLFPPGSNTKDTEARPEVWSQPEPFQKRATQAKEAASHFLEVVQKGDSDTIKRGFKSLLEACKACHEDFRQ